MDRDEKINRGEAARRLLLEPLLVEAFEKLDAAYIKAWRESNDDKVKEYCHFGTKAVAAMRRHLEIIISTGEIATKQIQIEEDRKRGVTSLFRRANG